MSGEVTGPYALGHGMKAYRLLTDTEALEVYFPRMGGTALLLGHVIVSKWTNDPRVPPMFFLLGLN